MGEVIYGASTLEFYGAVLAVMLVIGVLGLMGIINGIRRKHERIFIRVARGCSGVFFWLLGLVLLYVIYNSMTTGSKTVTVQVNSKEATGANCVSGGTCYVLEAQSNSRYIDLVVSKEAYNKIQINSCYLITFYSGDGLFGRSDDGSSYDRIDTVTKIETAACP